MPLFRFDKKDWNASITKVATSISQSPASLATVLPDVRATTDRFLKHKRFHGPEDRDQVLRTLMELTPPGEAHTLGVMACSHALSRGALQEISANQWSALERAATLPHRLSHGESKALGHELVLLEALTNAHRDVFSPRDAAAVDALRKLFGRHAPLDRVMSYALRDERPACRELLTYLANPVHRDEPGPAYYALLSIFSTWLGRCIDALPGRPRSREIAKALAVVELYWEASALDLANLPALHAKWRAWQPAKERIALYERMPNLQQVVVASFLEAQGPAQQAPYIHATRSEEILASVPLVPSMTDETYAYGELRIVVPAGAQPNAWVRDVIDDLSGCMVSMLQSGEQGDTTLRQLFAHVFTVGSPTNAVTVTRECAMSGSFAGSLPLSGAATVTASAMRLLRSAFALPRAEQRSLLLKALASPPNDRPAAVAACRAFMGAIPAGSVPIFRDALAPVLAPVITETQAFQPTAPWRSLWTRVEELRPLMPWVAEPVPHWLMELMHWRPDAARLDVRERMLDDHRDAADPLNRWLKAVVLLEGPRGQRLRYGSPSDAEKSALLGAHAVPTNGNAAQSVPWAAQVGAVVHAGDLLAEAARRTTDNPDDGALRMAYLLSTRLPWGTRLSRTLGRLLAACDAQQTTALAAALAEEPTPWEASLSLATLVGTWWQQWSAEERAMVVPLRDLVLMSLVTSGVAHTLHTRRDFDRLTMLADRLRLLCADATVSCPLPLERLRAWTLNGERLAQLESLCAWDDLSAPLVDTLVGLEGPDATADDPLVPLRDAVVALVAADTPTAREDLAVIRGLWNFGTFAPQEILTLTQLDDGPSRGQVRALLQHIASGEREQANWVVALLMQRASAHGPLHVLWETLVDAAELAPGPVPQALICAKRGVPLTVPVVGEDGRTYERGALAEDEGTPFPDLLMGSVLEAWDPFGLDLATYVSTLRCPITGGPFTHPVICPNGRTYEGPALASWLRVHATDPFTGEAVTMADVRPHRVIAGLLAEATDDADAETRTIAFLASMTDVTPTVAGAFPEAPPWLPVAQERLDRDMRLLREELRLLALDAQEMDSTSAVAPELLQNIAALQVTTDARQAFERLVRSLEHAPAADSGSSAGWTGYLARLVGKGKGKETANDSGPLGALLWRNADRVQTFASELAAISESNPLPELFEDAMQSPALTVACARAAERRGELDVAVQVLEAAHRAHPSAEVTTELFAVYAKRHTQAHGMPGAFPGTADIGDDASALYPKEPLRSACRAAAEQWNGAGPLPRVLLELFPQGNAQNPNPMLDAIGKLGVAKALRVSLWHAGVEVLRGTARAAAPQASHDADAQPFTCAVCTEERTADERFSLVECSCANAVCKGCTAEGIRTAAGAGVDRCPNLCGGFLTRQDLERLGFERGEVELRLGRVVRRQLEGLADWHWCKTADCNGGRQDSGDTMTFTCDVCAVKNVSGLADREVVRVLLEGVLAYDNVAHVSGTGITRECYHCGWATEKDPGCLHMSCRCGGQWDFLRGPYNRNDNRFIPGFQQHFRPLQDGTLADIGLYKNIPRGELTDEHTRIVSQRATEMLAKLNAGTLDLSGMKKAS